MLSLMGWVLQKLEEINLFGILSWRKSIGVANSDKRGFEL